MASEARPSLLRSHQGARGASRGGDAASGPRCRERTRLALRVSRTQAPRAPSSPATSQPAVGPTRTARGFRREDWGPPSRGSLSSAIARAGSGRRPPPLLGQKVGCAPGAGPWAPWPASLAFPSAVKTHNRNWKAGIHIQRAARGVVAADIIVFFK